jgi:hypothetical protein
MVRTEPTIIQHMGRIYRLKTNLQKRIIPLVLCRQNAMESKADYGHPLRQQYLEHLMMDDHPSG